MERAQQVSVQRYFLPAAPRESSGAASDSIASQAAASGEESNAESAGSKSPKRPGMWEGGGQDLHILGMGGNKPGLHSCIV